MDDEPLFDAEPSSESTSIDSGSAQYVGAFFPNSQHFVVTGGIFKSKVADNINQAAPNLPSGTVRRMYSAKIDGRTSNMTVALYQGDDTEEEWLEAISRYSWLRHPNFVQLYGVASTPELHVAVFHDVQLLVLISSLLSCLEETDFRDVSDYCRLTCQISLPSTDCTIWIRRSTRRLCADLVPSGLSSPLPFYIIPDGIPRPHNIISFNEKDGETAAISALPVEPYHEISYWHLSKYRHISTSTQATVNLGGIIYCWFNSQFEDSVEKVATLPDDDFLGNN
ncbi:hypothetical protein C8R44DRAFT_856432 [Mycena epipterygia]|nr:hypothetical protein C8R44DRAFT_856432 [Mycena epipterygia]